MPMHVVRTKRMKDELERQKLWREKQRERGSKVDKAINSNFMPPGKDDVLVEEDLSLNPPSIKSDFQRDGYSAIGRQKMRGKSKPPRGAI